MTTQNVKPMREGVLILPRDDESTVTVSSAIDRREHWAPADPDSDQRMRLMEASGVLDFWDEPEEDIYDESDGEPA